MSIVQNAPPRVDDPIQNFLEHCHRKSHKAKATIIRQGDPSHDLFYIVKGSVTVLLEDEEGRELVLADGAAHHQHDVRRGLWPHCRYSG